MRRQTRTWLLVVALTAGAIVGSVIGEALRDAVPVLSKGFTVGLEPPLVLDLNVLSFSFGFQLHLNLAGAIVVLLLVLLLGR
ncbi:MAG TPA: DUF4321 domain-containing protein [Firmicutes bacterium]|nr:DUF4321 domain-containing protein [Candidatus Fermentithermobacillaceae bacterium]